MTDEDLQSIIASTLTCRVDHQYVSCLQNCYIPYLCLTILGSLNLVN